MVKNTHLNNLETIDQNNISKKLSLISNFCTGKNGIDYLLGKGYLISNLADGSLRIAIMDTDLGSAFAQENDSGTYLFDRKNHFVTEIFFHGETEPQTSTKAINSEHEELLSTISGYCTIPLSEIPEDTSKNVNYILAA